MMARGLCRAAAVLLVATAWGRAWPVCLAPWGSLGRLSLLLHMALHLTLFGESRKPTSPAVWGITNPYISCCGANPQFFVGGVHRFWTIQLRKLFTQSHSRQPFIVHSHIVSAALEIKQIADVVFVHNHIEVGNTWSALILEAAEPRTQPNIFLKKRDVYCIYLT